MITKRLKRKFHRDAKLLEAHARAVATFASNSPEAARAASDITLVGPLQGDRPPARNTSPPPVDEMGNQTGVQGPPNLTGALPRGAEIAGNRLTIDDGELPDESERKVTPDAPAEEKNKAGTFEALLQMAGGMGGHGSS